MAKSVVYNNVRLMQNSVAFELHDAWVTSKDPKMKKLWKEKLDAHMKALDQAEKELMERYNAKDRSN